MCVLLLLYILLASAMRLMVVKRVIPMTIKFSANVALIRYGICTKKVLNKKRRKFFTLIERKITEINQLINEGNKKKVECRKMLSRNTLVQPF